ncbi:MAG: hypothetical protein H7Z43_01745 [Clostridia bacterium]|nr:hypothetical protein [Deltaproteobacteria bacterium]
MKLTRATFLGAALSALAGCMGFGDTDASVLESVPDEVSYADIAQITATYCLRCHNTTNNQGDFRCDTYDELFKDRRDAQGDVDQGLMPPLSEPPMSETDRLAFVKWVEQGALQTVDNGAQ